MDKLGDMDLFVRVVKNSGLAAAGREVGLSPASMSARINALEARYSARLLNRSTRRVSLTEIGQEFYEVCLRILADVSESEAHILANKNMISGSLRITAPSVIGKLHIEPMLSKFVENNPEIHPFLHLTDNIVDITETGFDCAIRYGDLPDSALVAKKLTSNYRVLCASPDYLKRKGHPQNIQELREHDCIAFNLGPELVSHWYFNGNNGLESVVIKAVRSSNDGVLLSQWALEGVGIALKSYLEVCDDIKAGRLVVILDEFTADFLKGKAEKNMSKSSLTNADLHFVYPSRQYLPRRVKLFKESLLSYFKALDNT